MFAAALLLLAVCDLGETFSNPEGWKTSAEDFVVDHVREGFTFASQKRDIVNSLKRGTATWLGRDVWETRVYFGAPGEATRVEMSLYNNGDRRVGDDFSLSDLKALVRDIQAKYGAGQKPPKSAKTKLKTGGFRYETRWTAGDGGVHASAQGQTPAVELVWGADDGGIRYVRATLTPKGAAKPKAVSGPLSGQASAAKARAHVKRNPDGDVWIDGVPMVDQGQKGYCAAAVAERILRYYGNDIDEHEIAQQAGTEAQGGTRISDMIATIRTIGSKRRLGFNQVVAMGGSLDDLAKDIDQYNRAAKAMKEPSVSMAQHTVGNLIMVGEIYDAMKPKVMKRARTKDARYKKFLAEVRTQVEKGVPVCWGVTLGIFPEPGVSLQTRGGHLRLIIGYNAKTHEILYTDTWGAGHELKRMPEDWAFTITHDVFFLRPL